MKKDYVILIAPETPRSYLGAESDEDDGRPATGPERTSDAEHALRFDEHKAAQAAIKTAVKRYPAHQFRLDVEAPTIRNMTCCVCGADAGRWRQHHNRDDGYGICTACVARQSATETPERIANLYGQAGINHSTPMIKHYGLNFRVLAVARTPAQANAFMLRTPGASLLFISDDDHFIAHQDDMGEPAHAATSAVPLAQTNAALDNPAAHE